MSTTSDETRLLTRVALRNCKSYNLNPDSIRDLQSPDPGELLNRDGSNIVTSHSPDVLDDESIPDDSILAVVAEHGETMIGRLDSAGRSALEDRLYAAGELLRLDQPRPDPAKAQIDPDQLDLSQPAD